MFQENQFNVEELLKDKNNFFHIGIPGLTKELENDRMILLAARTGMGKTRLLTRIANGACINLQKVVFFSLKTPKSKIMKEMVYNTVRSNDEEIENHNIETMKNKFLTKGSNEYYKNCYIFDKLYTSAEVYNTLLDLERELNGIDLVIIKGIEELLDYNEDTCVKIVALFKYFEAHNNVRFIISTNVSRRCDFREDKKPKVYDILNFSKINRSFDKIAILYREKYYDKLDTDNLLELGLYSRNSFENKIVFRKDSTFYTRY